MSTIQQTETQAEAKKILTNPSPQAVGESFLAALAARDFETLGQIFLPEVHFRSLVPSGERFGMTSVEAVGWLRKWFGNKDEIQVVQSDLYMVENVLALRYRLRVHDNAAGWQVIEQTAYCTIREGQIAEMRLICSGFLREGGYAMDLGANSLQALTAKLGGTLFYDAGQKGCAEGPLEEIARLMRQLDSGKTLEVHATAPSVAADLPAWCRLTGHELVKHEADHYLILHK